MTSHPHFVQLRHLLDLESRAEAARLAERTQRRSGKEAERRGEELTEMALVDEEPALGGRVQLTFSKRNQQLELPWNRLNVGAPVLIVEEGAGGSLGWRGVVCGRDANAIQIACERSPEPAADRPTFCMRLSSDEVARQRQISALRQAEQAERGRLAQLRDVLLGARPPARLAEKPLAPTAISLNESQMLAVQFALGAQDVAIIHGPPGTGKTTTVAELVRQATLRGEKVLACAASNLAVDNLLERLVNCGVSAIRLGHPARVLPELQSHTLDLLVDAHPDLKVARGLVKKADKLRDQASRFTRGKPAAGAKQGMRQEARELLADARRIEARLIEHLLDSTDVLCATLTGLDGAILEGRTFDLAVIDEAAQATEPTCWIPLTRAGRLVLAGDHCQLPPTVISDEAGRDGLKTSLLERLMLASGPDVARQLVTQYRMHAAIMDFSSGEFYGGTLAADESVVTHTLAGLPGVEESPLTLSPLTFIDTAGAGYDEEAEEEGESRLNRQEASLAIRKIQELLQAGVAPQQLAVICPYAAQARWLQSLALVENIPPSLEIDTVDGFQGREKEAVIITLVRSNPRGEIGFLSDIRRMNVALTRARRKLIVIGDSATIAGHPFYRRMLDYFETHGAYHTVWE